MRDDPAGRKKNGGERKEKREKDFHGFGYDIVIGPGRVEPQVSNISGGFRLERKKEKKKKMKEEINDEDHVHRTLMVFHGREKGERR